MAPFGHLGSDAYHAVSRIEIVALQRTHFFAPQPRIVGKSSHTARPQRSLFDHSQKGPPLLIARNPWQGLEARYQRPFTISSKCLSGRESSTTNRVICSLSLLDEEIKKQVNGCQSLLKRRIRQASQWSEIRRAVVRRWARAPTKIADIASEICPCGRHWRNSCSLAETQKVIKATCVSIQGVRSQAQQCFCPQPCFCKITSWEGAKQTHRRFVEDYNQQPHWGHRNRDNHRHTPAEVLGWVTGKMRTPEQLHRICYATRFLRSLDRFGYARFRRWRPYAEEGLARRQTVLWLYGDTLTLEYANAPLSQYTVQYQPDKQHFLQVKDPRHFETPYQSPQQPLWEPASVEWHPAQRLPDYAPRRSRKHHTRYVQPPLLNDEQAGHG